MAERESERDSKKKPMHVWSTRKLGYAHAERQEGSSWGTYEIL
jgi:hypothetical protein